MKNKKVLKNSLLILVAFLCLFSLFGREGYIIVNAQMPFYNLQPKEIVLRSQFYTSYPSSTSERKHNIKLASESINNTFVDVGGEFSFNRVVGKRTQQRGYKTAKIISNGTFVDGIGGGVCQVSTTLYNAVLLSGLKIIEYHPHSLSVSYVAPSFDAMVSSVSDFKFINNTHNPIIIKSHADDSTIKISIYGEKMAEKYIRKSIVTETINPPENQIIYVDENEYPELALGQSMVIQFAKNGLVSEGVLIKLINGKIIESKTIRRDKYKAIQGIEVLKIDKIAEQQPKIP